MRLREGRVLRRCLIGLMVTYGEGSEKQILGVSEFVRFVFRMCVGVSVGESVGESFCGHFIWCRILLTCTILHEKAVFDVITYPLMPQNRAVVVLQKSRIMYSKPEYKDQDACLFAEKTCKKPF